MKLIFTLDDGLKSHLNFYEKVGKRATYFIVPHYTGQAVPPHKFWETLCNWDDVRGLCERGEIGFHGHSAESYDKWPEEKVRQKMREGMEMFQDKLKVKPVSFAYSDMTPGRIDLIREYCPIIRDYFWRDGKVLDYHYPEGEYKFRIPENQVPAKFLRYRKRIFVMRPTRDIIYMVKRTKYLSTLYDYCIIIYHKLDNQLLDIAVILATVWECITFREIFE